MMMIITILKVPVAPAGAFATSGGGGGKPKISRLIWVLLGQISPIWGQLRVKLR